MVGDASLGFRYFSLQIGYGFLRLAGRTGYLAKRKPSIFQGLHGVTVLLELNPGPATRASTRGRASALGLTALGSCVARLYRDFLPPLGCPARPTSCTIDV